MRVLLLLLGTLVPSLVRAQATTDLVSKINSDQNNNLDTMGGALSADGRFIAFQWNQQHYVYDRQTQVTEMVSVSAAGVPGNQFSGARPSISADGRYVTFTSNATNLVDGDTNGKPDVFVRDRLNHTTERVSISSTGVQGNDESAYPSISADGRYVAFYSQADNLVAGDTNGYGDIFVRDRLNQTTERVSISSAGMEGDYPSHTPSLSADGRYVAFSSGASNLASGISNGFYNTFVHDRVKHTTELINVSSSGVLANDGTGEQSSLSSDGRYVVFWSYADNLVPGDTNHTADVFVRDRQNQTTERITLNSQGVEADAGGYVDGCSISADGRYVVFLSMATNLAPNVRNGAAYIRDLVQRTTRAVSVSTAGKPANKGSVEASLSADGQYATFNSPATNLVPGITNGVIQVYVRGPLAADTQVTVLTSLNPNSTNAVGPAFTLALKGSAFGGSSTVNWTQGNTTTTLTITFVSSSLLKATVPASLLTAPGKASVSVANPGEGTSNSKPFTILLTTLKLLSVKLTKDSAGNYTANLTLKNAGYLSAPNVQLTKASLGAAMTSTTLPVSLGSISAGATGAAALGFPSSAGGSGRVVTLKVSSTFTGGTFNGSLKVTLP